MHRKDQTKIIGAFDLLFKIYYTFNLRFPIELLNFYTFIAYYIYKLTDIRPVSIVRALHINLINYDASKANKKCTENSETDDSDEEY